MAAILIFAHEGLGITYVSGYILYLHACLNRNLASGFCAVPGRQNGDQGCIPKIDAAVIASLWSVQVANWLEPTVYQYNCRRFAILPPVSGRAGPSDRAGNKAQSTMNCIVDCGTVYTIRYVETSTPFDLRYRTIHVTCDTHDINHQRHACMHAWQASKQAEISFTLKCRPCSQCKDVSAG